MAAGTTGTVVSLYEGAALVEVAEDDHLARHSITFYPSPSSSSSTIDELVEPAALIHTPLPIQATGPQLLKEVSVRLRRAFPDLLITIEDLIEEGDKVVSRQSVTGTHQGDYMGIPPTGRSVNYNEVFVVRFVDGRIAETWGIVDVLSQMRQLGVISSSGPIMGAAGSLQ